MKWQNVALPCRIVVRSASTIGSVCQGSLESPHVKANVAWDKFYGINKNQGKLLPTVFIEGNNVVSFRNCYLCRMVFDVANSGGVNEECAPKGRVFEHLVPSC